MLSTLMIWFFVSDSQVVAVAVERFLTVRFPFHKVLKMICPCCVFGNVLNNRC